ncbi:MAG: SLC13 family permease [Thermoleophilia bacterium]
MSVDAVIVLVVSLLVLGVLVSERVSPALTVLGGVVALLAAQVIDVDQAVSGFSNAAPLSVAALYVVAAAVGRTRVVERGAALLSRRGPREGPVGERVALARVAVPTATASAFLNNTPIVAMAIPSVLSWARRNGSSPSRLLMPVSFAAVVGGTVTLIGTSTNLVVSGLMDDAGQRPMGLWEIGMVGLPFAVVALVLMIALGPRLLPVRRAPAEGVDDDAREFTVEMVVTADPGGVAGRSIAEAGLRNLQGVYLVELERGGNLITSVRPDEVLSVGDRLIFAGNVTRVLDLQGLRGLASSEGRHFAGVGSALERRLYEAVVAPGSALVGSTLKQSEFRGRYGGSVIAIHRADERVGGKLGDVPLRTGDVLLVLAGPAFRLRARDRRDFLVVAPLDGDPPPREEKALPVALVVVGLIVVASTGLLDILTAALLAAFAVVALRVLTPTEAREAVDLDVIVLIAASFGLGKAMEVSGLAADLADGLVEPFGAWGDRGLLLGVILATIIVTEMISNNAAAALMFPIAMATASAAGLDPRGFAFAVAIGASSSFLTPIGYQTNTMVYGIGGYRFGDFARLGFPLAIAMVVVSVLLIPVAWPLR